VACFQRELPSVLRSKPLFQNWPRNLLKIIVRQTAHCSEEELSAARESPTGDLCKSHWDDVLRNLQVSDARSAQGIKRGGVGCIRAHKRSKSCGQTTISGNAGPRNSWRGRLFLDHGAPASDPTVRFQGEISFSEC